MTLRESIANFDQKLLDSLINCTLDELGETNQMIEENKEKSFFSLNRKLVKSEYQCERKVSKRMKNQYRRIVKKSKNLCR